MSDALQIKSLNLKIERMHKEIEAAQDKIAELNRETVSLGEQLEYVTKLNNAIGAHRAELIDKVVVVKAFLDVLWKDKELSKLFRANLAKVRCELCDSKYDCSVIADPEECLFDVTDSSTDSGRKSK
jgi:chromosome segregation ATPase